MKLFHRSDLLYFLLIIVTVNETKAYEVIVENITQHWTGEASEHVLEKIAKLKKEINEFNNIPKITTPSEKNDTGFNKRRKGPPEPVYGPRRILVGGFKGTGPTGLDDEHATTCDEFSENARFNPYSVLEEQWFSFFYWALDHAPLVLQFKSITGKFLKKLQSVLDPQVKDPIDWDARKVLMVDQIYNATAVLIERGERGQFWLYPYVIDFPEKLEPIDVRLKQTGDNKYIGFMECINERVYVLSRMNDIPAQTMLQVEASRIGYRGRRGRSYLYQGHHWMPIPEMDEVDYWAPDNYGRQDIPDPRDVFHEDHIGHDDDDDLVI